jgi:hypothetical protein
MKEMGLDSSNMPALTWVKFAELMQSNADLGCIRKPTWRRLALLLPSKRALWLCHHYSSLRYFCTFFTKPLIVVCFTHIIFTSQK